MITENRVINLERKLDKAAKLSRKHSDAISLAHEAFYSLFDKCITDCKCDVDGSPECKLNSLFWDYITEGETPDNIADTQDLVVEMLRLMNEIEKKGDD